MTSRPFFTRMHETVRNMSSALDSAQTFENEVHEFVVGGPETRGRKRVEGGGRCFMREGVCFFLEPVSEGDERAGAAFVADDSPATGLSDLFSVVCLTSFVNAVNERLCGDNEFCVLTEMCDWGF